MIYWLLKQGFFFFLDGRGILSEEFYFQILPILLNSEETWFGHNWNSDMSRGPGMPSMRECTHKKERRYWLLLCPGDLGCSSYLSSILLTPELHPPKIQKGTLQRITGVKILDCFWKPAFPGPHPCEVSFILMEKSSHTLKIFPQSQGECEYCCGIVGDANKTVLSDCSNQTLLYESLGTTLGAQVLRVQEHSTDVPSVLILSFPTV